MKMDNPCVSSSFRCSDITWAYISAKKKTRYKIFLNLCTNQFNISVKLMEFDAFLHYCVFNIFRRAYIEYIFREGMSNTSIYRFISPLID
jgi:hypothetical protein